MGSNPTAADILSLARTHTVALTVHKHRIGPNDNRINNRIKKDRSKKTK